MQQTSNGHSTESSREEQVGVIRIQSIVSSRYPNHERPVNWDRRVSGIDVVLTNDGRTVRLLSDGSQSPPKPGWGIILRDGDGEGAYRWTLYAVPRGAAIPVNSTF